MKGAQLKDRFDILSLIANVRYWRLQKRKRKNYFNNHCAWYLYSRSWTRTNLLGIPILTKPICNWFAVWFTANVVIWSSKLERILLTNVLWNEMHSIYIHTCFEILLFIRWSNISIALWNHWHKTAIIYYIWFWISTHTQHEYDFFYM